MKKSDFHPLLRLFVYIMILVFTIMTIYPLIWLGISSLKSTTEFQLNRLGRPINPTLRNYPAAWRLGKFDILFLNSLFFTITSTIATVLLSLSDRKSVV